MDVIGRFDELRAIGKALDGVDDGPSAVTIFGEPGIGKTAVWRWGVAEARARGYQVLCCRPAESEAWLSFSGLADLMELAAERALADLPDVQQEALHAALLKSSAASARADHRALLMAVTQSVRSLAQDRPVVIAVDDAQWMDVPTAEVLAFAARRLGDAPVLMLVTRRTRGRPGEALPFGLSQALQDDRVLRLLLGPLSPDRMHELVRERTGILLSRPELVHLHGASGGNPFFAIEIVRLLVKSGVRLSPDEPLPLPESLAELVTARVGALPERTREALLAASALAHPSVRQVSAAISPGPGLPGTAEGLLEDAEAGGIIDIRDGRISFTHPLFSSAIYSSAPSARRRQLHRSLAAIVDDAEEQARHLALAVEGPGEAVAAALEKAARAAQARGAIGAEARLWELAERRTPPGDPDNVSRRGLAAATSVFVTGDTRRARSMLEAVISGMTAGRRRARALLLLATIVFFERSSTAAAAMCRKALAETESDLLLRATLHLRAAWFAEHDIPGRVRDAEAAAEILEGGQVAAGPDVLASALLARGYYRFLAGHGTVGEDLARGRALLPPRHRSWEWAWARSILYHWAKVQDLEKARAECAALHAGAIRAGDETIAAHALFHLAEAECWLGDLAQAKAHAAAVTAAFEQTGQRRWRGLSLYIRALPDAYLGEVDAARAAAEQGLKIADTDDDPYLAVLHLGVLGFVALSVRQLDVADRHLSQADELVASMGIAEPARHRFHGDYLDTVVALGDLDRAAAIQQRLERRVRKAPYPWLRIVTARGRALVAAAQGDLDAAAAASEQALTECDTAALPFEHARTLLVAGQIRRRRREKLLARRAFERSCQIFDGLHAAVWSSYASGELLRLGRRPAAPFELTPSEDRVAHLVADGLTNREVASALCIGEKTVEASLSRIFRKLGILSRRELRGIEAPRRPRGGDA